MVEDFKVLGMNMISLSRSLNILLEKILFFCLYFCPPNSKSWLHLCLDLTLAKSETM